ncbi:MAG: type IV pilus biogenesis/stability protein PilW [Burkholderiaceae bacterium]
MPSVPSQIRSTHWMGAAFAAAALMAGLGGCVHSGGPSLKPQQGRTSNDGKDLATASDQTNADRLAKTRMDLAAAYFARGQSTDALDEVKLSLVARPDNPDAYALRGLIYAALGEAGTADESFLRAKQLAPHDGDVMHNYAWFLCQQKRYPEADAEFRRAMAEPAYKSTARTLLAEGVCEARAGQLAESERTLSRAYELDPANPTTAVNLAQVLYKNGQYERARFYIRRVNMKDEMASAQTLWLSAQIEHKLGQEDQVQDLGIQLRKRFPQSPEALLFDKGKFEE